jgi:hypothetical protein
MRRPLMRISSTLIGSGLLVLGVTACGSSSNLADLLAGSRGSPFALFGRRDMRAGIRYEVLKEAASKESVKQFVCVPLWVKAQRCSVAIDPGTLTAIVDSTGRVVRLLAATDPMLRNGINVHGQLIFRDVIHDTRLSWDSVGISRRDDSDPTSPELRWLDRTQRWASSLWYSRGHRADVSVSSDALDAELAMTLPESIGVTDLPAYALFIQRRPTPSVVENSPPRTYRVPPPPPATPEELLNMLRSDLREVTIAEEGVVHRTGSYETRLEQLDIKVSEGVKVELLHASEYGWSAVATHPGLPGFSCVVFAGDAPRPVTSQQAKRGTTAGEIVCDQL